MRRIWMAIAPTRHETRILATDGPSDTLLKARLSSRMQHPRALASLMEALALWQGHKVHAVVAVDADSPTYAWTPGEDLVGHEDTPLYAMDYALTEPAPQRDISGIGLGSFGDLHRLLASEVAR